MNQILGRSQDSENAYRRAVALGQQLAADFPTRPEFRQDLAMSHNNLGLLLNATGRLTEAEAAYAEALAIKKQLAADFPDPARVPRGPWPGATTTWATCSSTPGGRRKRRRPTPRPWRSEATRRRIPHPARAPRGPGDEPQQSWLVVPKHRAAEGSGGGLRRVPGHL